MKLYPRLETNKYGSLKFYLQDNQLPTKVDLPIPVLWRYYESGDKDHMREIAYYCIVDTISVQRLFVKRSIITDYREISTLAYVSLSDSHYYAGGVKVCNLVCAYAWPDILINMKPKYISKVEKYPGAYVFPPDKGITPNVERLQKYKNGEEINLEKDRPVTCLDFASLYPSLIMAYNLSPEKLLFDIDQSIDVNDNPVHLISFDIGEKHITAWSILHQNDKTKMGLFPVILMTLFNKRKEMKKLLKVLTDKKEIYELIFSTNDDYNIAIDNIKSNFEKDCNELQKPITFIPPGSTLEDEEELRKNRKRDIKMQIEILSNIKINTIQQDYENICFEAKCIDKKQNALKIYMNTFYGETGNHLSPFFILQLAGGVTSAGQYNIKLVAEYVKQRGYFIKYGDTDSLYLSCPNVYFAECDEYYKLNKYTKEEYFSAMVKISMRVMTKLEEDINKFLITDNGTNFLKIENEGTLFPCVFLGKKKYFGIQHVNEVNFHPKKIYIKGIEVIKQGKSGIEKEIGNTIMKQAINIDNEKTMIEIVMDILKDSIQNNRWNFGHFVQTSSWKPTKNNAAVQRFMKRMSARHELELRENELLTQNGQEPKELLYSPLDPGERFSYVLVKNNILYDAQGKKIYIKTGDIMEYSHIAQQKNMEIDIVYYLIHYVIGTCARFISSDDQFMPSEIMDDKKADEYSVKLAKKMLENYIKDVSGLAKNTDMGKECKALFKLATQSISVSPIIKDILHGPITKIAFDESFEKDEDIIDIVFSCATKKATELYKKHYTTFCGDVCELFDINIDGSDKNNPDQSNNLYKYIHLSKRHLCGKLENDLRKELILSLKPITDISIQYKTDILFIIDKIKNKEMFIPSLDYSELQQFIAIWYNIVGFELYKLQILCVSEYLDGIKYKRTKSIKKPSKIEINNLIKNAIKKV